jgi:hypothetical protein
MMRADKKAQRYFNVHASAKRRAKCSIIRRAALIVAVQMPAEIARPLDVAI